jgi:asparagine synthase (glutamine-hydrolysing)
MCGILVAVAKTGGLDQAACRRALATMSWRGPDFAWSRTWEDRVFLGQTVLSITGDPRPGVGEYHRSCSGRSELVYNGEIYNFRALETALLRPGTGAGARYGSDTEVLAQLHDVLPAEEVPARLEGMYAYALLDTTARQVHVARDVQGEKSLYVFEDGVRIVIASEIRAILALVRDVALDAQMLRDYFRTRHFMPFERTAWQGIRQLLPGRLETLDLESLKWTAPRTLAFRDWIDPAQMERNALRDADDLADELDALLDRCAREMVPRERRWAVVVSGGVDSSLLARYLLRHGDPTVLVAVNHVGKDRISNDLGGFARALGRPIEVVRVDAPAYASEIARCQAVTGGPLHSHSFVPQAMQSAVVRAHGARVLFGGDGADELFGGYEAYVTPPPAPGRYSPSPYTRHETPRFAFVEDAPAAMEADLASAWAESLDAYAAAPPAERVGHAMMLCDAVYQLPTVGLRGADLMSMMWSVETRTIYVRPEIVRFAVNLPLRAKADASAPALLRAKPLLKRLFLRHFPAELLVEKQGFAGFPNDAAAYLGDPRDYRALEVLGIRPDSLAAGLADTASAWKLINTEYFLRHGTGGAA